MLGLGVAEPLPSWGTLLRELEGYSIGTSPVVFVPLVLLITTVGSFQLAIQHEEVRA
jgi:ABC-type dipeptide/oligopeptide/nickel transport system permease subunit